MKTFAAAAIVLLLAAAFALTRPRYAWACEVTAVGTSRGYRKFDFADEPGEAAFLRALHACPKRDLLVRLRLDSRARNWSLSTVEESRVVEDLAVLQDSDGTWLFKEESLATRDEALARAARALAEAARRR